MLPILDPIPKGIALALGAVAVASLGAAFFMTTIPAASPELLRSLATIGAILLVGYIVEAVWLANRAELNYEYEEWLGFATGTGIAGFLGIAVALLAAEHRAGGHNSFLDDLALGWIVASMAILGVTLILQPLLANRFGDTEID